MMNTIKQIVRIILAAIIGYNVVQYLDLNDFIAVVFYFGIYIAVSMIIEPLWDFLEKKLKKD